MHASAALFSATKPFQAASTAPRSDRRRMQVSCMAMPEGTGRRGLLAGLAGSLAALPLLTAAPADAKMVSRVVAKDNLSSFQRGDLLADFQKRAIAEIEKVVTVADAPTAMRLLFNDAATYDGKTRTGGVNGSVVLSEELSRPENKDLKDLVDRLGKARQAIIAGSPSSQKPISWADTIVLAVKVTQLNLWTQEKLKKNPKNGEYLVKSFPNPINVRLGRVDATTPDAAGRIPAPGASAQDVLAFSKTLGVKKPEEYEGPFAKKVPFWERVIFVLWTAAQPDPAAAEAQLAAEAPDAFAQYKEKYDKSKATTFRQDYEIDFNEFLNRLADLGANFDKDAYLYDITIQVPDS